MRGKKQKLGQYQICGTKCSRWEHIMHYTYSKSALQWTISSAFSVHTHEHTHTHWKPSSERKVADLLLFIRDAFRGYRVEVLPFSFGLPVCVCIIIARIEIYSLAHIRGTHTHTAREVPFGIDFVGWAINNTETVRIHIHKVFWMCAMLVLGIGKNCAVICKTQFHSYSKRRSVHRCAHKHTCRQEGMHAHTHTHLETAHGLKLEWWGALAAIAYSFVCLDTSTSDNGAMQKHSTTMHTHTHAHTWTAAVAVAASTYKCTRTHPQFPIDTINPLISLIHRANDEKSSMYFPAFESYVFEANSAESMLCTHDFLAMKGKQFVPILCTAIRVVPFWPAVALKLSSFRFAFFSPPFFLSLFPLSSSCCCCLPSFARYQPNRLQTTTVAQDPRILGYHGAKPSMFQPNKIVCDDDPISHLAGGSRLKFIRFPHAMLLSFSKRNVQRVLNPTNINNARLPIRKASTTYNLGNGDIL